MFGKIAELLMRRAASAGGGKSPLILETTQGSMNLAERIWRASATTIQIDD
jgi:hypothetical protein